MDKSQLLTYGLLLLGFLLFNYVVQQMAKRTREQQEREQAQQQDATPPPEDEPLEDLWGRRPQAGLPASPAPAASARPVETVAASPAPPPGRTVPRARLFQSRQDLRHAVIVMTVLGPCRTLEPYDRQQAGLAAGGATPRPS